MNTLVDFESMRAGEAVEEKKEAVRFGSSVIVTHRGSHMFGLHLLVTGERRSSDRHGKMYTSAWRVHAPNGDTERVPVDGVRLDTPPDKKSWSATALVSEDVEL